MTKIYRDSDKIITLDIEVSNYFVTKDDKIIEWDFSKDSDYYKEVRAGSLCYMWQLSIGEDVIIGRDLKTLPRFLTLLHRCKKQKIWVHNLSYEFQFLLNILTVKSVFARKERKPIKVVFDEYPNFEFRCTYFLTGMSLAALGKSIGMNKRTDIADYRKVRTPLTPLTEDEIRYGAQDCLIVHKAIQEELMFYTMGKIPLTLTGKVRREVKSLLLKGDGSDEYKKMVKEMRPTADWYRILKKVYTGGYTHANYNYTGKVIKGKLLNSDISSSYPFVICTDKFPTSRFIQLNPDDVEYINEDYAYILRLKFHNIINKTPHSYISVSKCEDFSKNSVVDNGRILSSEYVDIYYTNIDFDIINQLYDYESLELLEVYRTEKPMGYLPKKLVEYVLSLYNRKTELKHVQGMESQYMRDKALNNSVYGMCCTGLETQEVVYTDEKGWQTFMEYDIESRLQDIDDNKSSYWLPFEWGVFITAYARRNLFTAILSNPEFVMYCDTDSTKSEKELDYTLYNKLRAKKIKDICEFYNLDEKLYRPKNKFGEECPLGEFTKEPDYTEFKTLGAKRYCARENGKLKITVSGINKEAVSCLKDDINNFDDKLVFKTYIEDENGVSNNPDVKHALVTYIDNCEIYDEFPDGYVNTYKYGINIRNSSYKISMSEEYKTLIHIDDARRLAIKL